MLKKLTVLFLLVLSLTSCSATYTAISKRNLTVDVSMKDSIFLEPVAPEDQIIYIKVRNTTGLEALNIESALIEKMRSKGFTITKSPKRANFMLIANVRKYGRFVDETERQSSELKGAAIGGVAGASAVYANDNNSTRHQAGYGLGLAVGAAIGGLTSAALDALVKDTYFEAIIDISVSERTQHGESVNYTTYQEQGKGDGSRVNATFSTESNWKKYKTVLTAKANKVNLEIEEATPAITYNIVNSLAGMF